MSVDIFDSNKQFLDLEPLTGLSKTKIIDVELYIYIYIQIYLFIYCYNRVRSHFSDVTQ